MSLMVPAFLFPLALYASPAAPPLLSAEAPPARPAFSCVAAAEARAAIVRHKLADPSPALRAMARRTQAEPLRSRLCRMEEQFVYEMALLRRDGKVVRVYVDAQDGRTQIPGPR
jgi:hypothetical protein